MKPSLYTDRYSQRQIDDYYGAGLWSTETFHDLLARHAEANPDKVFATDGTRSLTFRQLFDGAQRLAVGLRRQGWRAGDSAAVQLPSWVEFVHVLAALSRLGVIAVPIMPIYRREEVGYVLSNAGIRGVFTPASFKKFDYLDMYLGLRQEHPGLAIVVVRPDSAAEHIIDGEQLDLGELVLMPLGNRRIARAVVVLRRDFLAFGRIDELEIGLGRRARALLVDDLVDDRDARFGEDRARRRHWGCRRAGRRLDTDVTRVECRSAKPRRNGELAGRNSPVGLLSRRRRGRRCLRFFDLRKSPFHHRAYHDGQRRGRIGIPAVKQKNAIV